MSDAVRDALPEYTGMSDYMEDTLRGYDIMSVFKYGEWVAPERHGFRS